MGRIVLIRLTEHDHADDGSVPQTSAAATSSLRLSGSWNANLVYVSTLPRQMRVAPYATTCMPRRACPV